jgi:cytoskeletal protein RodZ
LSVDDVSADTRIRASLIAAIEADDFNPCGGTVYARGHVRTIAKVVGVDPDAAAHEFDVEQHVEPSPVVTMVTPQATDPVLAARSVHHRPNWNLAMGLALAVICVVAAVGLITSQGKGNHGPATNAGAGTSAGQHPSTPTGSGPSNSTGGKASSGTPPTGGLAVQQASMSVKALTSSCWIEIKSAKTGAVIFSGTLLVGQHQRFESKHGLNVIIGNAPAVDLVINGHDIGTLPGKGSVLEGTVTPDSSTIQTA